MDHVSKAELAERIRTIRHRRQMTQEQLADAAGLSAESIRRLESGRYGISFDSLVKISDGLAVPMAGLLDEQFDEADDLAAMIRALPEPHLQLAHALLGTLYVQAVVRKS